MRLRRLRLCSCFYSLFGTTKYTRPFYLIKQQNIWKYLCVYFTCIFVNNCILQKQPFVSDEHQKHLPKGGQQKDILKSSAKFTKKKNVCARAFLNKVVSYACNFIKKRPTELFPSKFCEIFKNTSFYRTPLKTASDSSLLTGLVSFKDECIWPFLMYIFERRQANERLIKVPSIPCQ